MILLKIAKMFFRTPEGKKRQRMQRALMYFCRLIPINQKKVVFSSYRGSSFDDSPKAIYMEMVRHRPDWKYIWLMPDENAHFRNAKAVHWDSFLAYYHLATARLWVDNCRKGSWTIKRKGQYYVQTWHAGVAIKKVEKDTEATLNAEYLANCKNDSKMADLFISGCRWCTENFREAFWYNGEILQIGLPRSDIFYMDHAVFRKKVLRYFGFPDSTKICLYVPTFRNKKELSCYDVDYERLKKTLEKKWGGEWKILVRLHPNVRYMQGGVEYNEDIINATPYGETNELTVSSDLIITDYSSCMFDGLEAHKRVLLYASDIEDYLKERELYFDLRKLPFMLAENNDELEGNIMRFDDDVYNQKAAALREELGFFNSEYSSRKVVKYILSKIEKG